MTTIGPEQAHAAALAGLLRMTPRRLVGQLEGRSPTEAWASLVASVPTTEIDLRQVTAARQTDPLEVGEQYARAGVAVLLVGQPGYPSPLVGDPGAPAVLFARGDPGVIEQRRRVAIVGTRSATPYGRQMASELGRDLAAEGVAVVSGLARGIDGAAHAGVVRAEGDDLGRPVGVVGTGVDVVYPASNQALWEEVASTGVVLSESPLGTVARPPVFPARNRIIAALSDVVVVVECHHQGGALITAEAAARRGIPVCAVPGSVRSRASQGTNGLLVDGCAPVRDAADVLVAVSLARMGRRVPSPVSDTGSLVAARGRDRNGGQGGGRGAGRAAGRGVNGRSANSSGAGGSPVTTRVVPDLPPGSPERAVFDAVEDIPTPLETILLRTSLSIPQAVDACHLLVTGGRLDAGAGWWSKR